MKTNYNGEYPNQKKEKPQLIYHVITSGKRDYKILKQGNKRATRIYKDGVKLRYDIADYLLLKDCKIYIHRKDATVRRIIESRKS